MTDRDQVVRTRLASAALVIGGLLAIALLLQALPEGRGETFSSAAVELGFDPVSSIACEWVGDVAPTRLNSIAVVEATAELNPTLVLGDSAIDFEPRHVWLQFDVDDHISRGFQQRVSPRALAESAGVREVVVRFDAVYNPNFPGVPQCSAEVAIS